MGGVETFIIGYEMLQCTAGANSAKRALTHVSRGRQLAQVTVSVLLLTIEEDTASRPRMLRT